MKIVKLNVSHHDDVVSLFGEDIKKYYFIISDLIEHRYSGEDFKVYGEYENNQLKSILLNNFDNLMYYSKNDRNVDNYKDIIKELNFKKISGPSHFVEKLKPFIKDKSDTLSYLGYVDNVDKKRKYPNLSIKTIKTIDEIKMHYNLLQSTEEYQDSLPDIDTYVNNIKNSINTNRRIVFLSIDNTMVSSCSTVLEHDKSAIIVGVVTNPKFRNKGYGSEVLIDLFETLLNEGKTPYLFYNNPIARSVYKKLGMIEVCEWRVLKE